MTVILLKLFLMSFVTLVFCALIKLEEAGKFGMVFLCFTMVCSMFFFITTLCSFIWFF